VRRERCRLSDESGQAQRNGTPAQCRLAWKAIAAARLLLSTDAGARWEPIARPRTPGPRPARASHARDRDDCSHARSSRLRRRRAHAGNDDGRERWRRTARFRIRRVMWRPRSLGRGRFGSSVPVARDIVSRALGRVREAEAVCLRGAQVWPRHFGPLSDPSDGVSPADLPLGARSRWMTTMARERDS
jgi:hypothetical protein